MTIDNGMVTSARSAEAASDAWERHCRQAEAGLLREYMDAARACNPNEALRTPGYTSSKLTRFHDEFVSDLRDEESADVVRILLQIGRGDPVTDAMRLRVGVIVGALAGRHAERHAESAL